MGSPARATHQPRVFPTAMLDEDEDERVDETALRQLTEMGFPESRAVKALRLNQYVGAASCPRCRCWGLVSWVSPAGDTPLSRSP